MKSKDKAALSKAIQKAIHSGTTFEEFSAAAETLWDGNNQSSVPPPEKVHIALVSLISKVKDPGPELFPLNARSLFLFEVRAVWNETVQAQIAAELGKARAADYVEGGNGDGEILTPSRPAGLSRARNAHTLKTPVRPVCRDVATPKLL